MILYQIAGDRFSLRERHDYIEQVLQGKKERCTPADYALVLKLDPDKKVWAVDDSLAHLNAQRIVNLYATRMQIEEALRDRKCERYSLGSCLNLSRARERIAALPLIV